MADDTDSIKHLLSELKELPVHLEPQVFNSSLQQLADLIDSKEGMILASKELSPETLVKLVNNLGNKFAKISAEIKLSDTELFGANYANPGGLSYLKVLLLKSPKVFYSTIITLKAPALLNLCEKIGVEFLRDNLEGLYMGGLLLKLPPTNMPAFLDKLGGGNYIREKLTNKLMVISIFQALSQEEANKVFDEAGIEFFKANYVKDNNVLKIINRLVPESRLPTIEALGGKNYIEASIKNEVEFEAIIKYYAKQNPELPIIDTLSAEFLNKIFKSLRAFAKFDQQVIKKIINKLDDSLLNASDTNDFFNYIKYYDDTRTLKILQQLPKEQFEKIIKSMYAPGLFLKMKSVNKSFQSIFELFGGLAFVKTLFNNSKGFINEFERLTNDNKIALLEYIGIDNVEYLFGAEDRIGILKLFRFIPQELRDKISGFSANNFDNQIKSADDIESFIAMRNEEEATNIIKGFSNDELKQLIKNSNISTIPWVTKFILSNILEGSWERFFEIYDLKSFFTEKVKNIQFDNTFIEIMESMPVDIRVNVINTLDTEYLEQHKSHHFFKEHSNRDCLMALVNKFGVKEILFENEPLKDYALLKFLENLSLENQLKVVEQFDIEIFEKYIGAGTFLEMMSPISAELKWDNICGMSGIYDYFLKVLDRSRSIVDRYDQSIINAFNSVLGTQFLYHQAKFIRFDKLDKYFNHNDITKMLLNTDFLTNNYEDVLGNIHIFNDDIKIKILLNTPPNLLINFREYAINNRQNFDEFMNSVPPTIKNDITFMMGGIDVLKKMPLKQQIDFLISLQTSTLKLFAKDAKDLNHLITNIPQQYVEVLITRLGGDNYIRVINTEARNVSEFYSAELQENLAKLYYPVAGENSYSHEAIIKFQNNLFEHPMLGVCAGIAMMSAQAFLTSPQELQKFSLKIDFLIQHPTYFSDGTHEKLMKQIVDDRDKIRMDIISQLQAEGKPVPSYIKVETNLSTEQQHAIDIAAFMNSLELYAAPHNHSETLGRNFTQNSMMKNSELLQPQALVDQGGMVVCGNISGIYEEDKSMDDYINLLSKFSSACDCNMAFRLNSNNHAISISYESDTKSWRLTDANNTVRPVKMINSIAELATAVYRAFENDTGKSAITTEVLSIGHNMENVKHLLNDLKKSADYHRLHDITEENKDELANRDLSQAQVAVFAADAERLSDLIRLQSKYLNHRGVYLPANFQKNNITAKPFHTPFELAMDDEKINCLKLLIDLKNDNGEFVIDIEPEAAARCLFLDSAKALKLVLEAKDTTGNLRMEIDGLYESARFKTNLHVPQKIKSTLVHDAVEYGAIESLKVLEECGANMTFEIDGQKPIDKAKKYNQEMVIEFYIALERRNDLTQMVEHLFQSGNINSQQAEKLKNQFIMEFRQDYQAFSADGVRGSNTFNSLDLEKLASLTASVTPTIVSNDVASKTEFSVSSNSDLDDIYLIDSSDEDEDVSNKVNNYQNSTATLSTRLGINSEIIKTNLQKENQILFNDKITEPKQMPANDKDFDVQKTENSIPTRRAR